MKALALSLGATWVVVSLLLALYIEHKTDTKTRALELIATWLIVFVAGPIFWWLGKGK